MSNYEGTFRTNYIKVKDLKKFKKELKQWVGSSSDGNDYEIWDGKRGKVALGGFCGLPQKVDKDGEFLDDEFAAFIQRHLKNDVAIITEIGYEKLRYLVGYTIYISPTMIIYKSLGFDREIIEGMGFDPDKVTEPAY